jgi:hypothetical protein
MSIRLPQSLHRNAREVAQRDGVSMNPWMATALAGNRKLSRSRREWLAAQRAPRRLHFLALGCVVADEHPHQEHPAGRRRVHDGDAWWKSRRLGAA